MCTSAVTSATQSQALGFHTFVMKTLVVMHDRQKRHMVIRSSPETSRAHHQITVLLNIDRDPAVFFIRDRRTDSSRRAIADAVSAGTADELIVFIEVPEFKRPILEERQICDK